MNWTIKKMKKASVARNLGSTKGMNVFAKPSWEKTMYCGMISTWIGSITDTSTIPK